MKHFILLFTLAFYIFTSFILSQLPGDLEQTLLLDSHDKSIKNLMKKNTNSNFFIENKGQWADEVKFLARIGGMNAWITDFGVVYDYYKIIRDYDQSKVMMLPEHERREIERGNTRIQGHIIKTIFNNKYESTAYLGESKQTAYYNYFIGNDKNKWASYVRLYEGVTVEELYEGIDIRYYFDKGFLRYDFVVKPGADISQINIALEGINYTINENGELELQTSIGKVTHKDIVAYQNNGYGKSEVVKTFFTKNETGIIGFIAENYDKGKELIIDPLVYSTFIGGIGENGDWGEAVVVDNNGNAYIGGYTASTNYPIVSGSYDESFNGDPYDAIITKMNADGSDIIYSTFIVTPTGR